MSNTNLEHLTAILLLGIGAILLTLSGHVSEALLLYGVLGGYAFRNGVATSFAAKGTVAASSDTTPTNQKPSAAT